MNKALKIILAVFVVGLLFAISPISNRKETNPKSTTDYIEAVVDSMNANLPFDLGTIGHVDSIRYEKNQKMVWYYTMYDRGDIQDIYTKYYEDYKDVIKMTFVIMNGQDGLGYKFASFFKNEQIPLEICSYSQSGECTQWIITGQEILDYMDEYRLSPTESLRRAIDFHFMIANLDLPQKPGMQTDYQSITTNSIFGYDETCLVQSINHIGDDIIIEYLVDEEEFDLDFFNANQGDIDFSDFIASILSEDPDTKAFISMISMAHSNWILILKGIKPPKEATISIPYSILKKYSKFQNLI